MFKRKCLGPLAVTVFYFVQIAQSYSRPEDDLSSDEWLLRELNGGHLRLSATVVRCLIKLKIVVYSIAKKGINFISTGSSLVNCASRTKWNGGL